MIAVAEARRRILDAFRPLPAEIVPLTEALGRVLAAPVAARVNHPWADASAMDGYAARSTDVAAVPVTLTRIGEAPAGRGFAGRVGPGQCVRIFTGAPVPEGADTIVIQEDTDADGDQVRVRETAAAGRYVRRRGLDFSAGEPLLPAGRLVTARDVALAAAMNVPWLTVHRRPRVAILSTGDEIVMPGDPIGPDQIVSANGPGLHALVTGLGGSAMGLGIAPDDRSALAAMAAGATGADLLVTTGGASVGDHDLVREAFGDVGLSLDFWKIAMRPGKPLMFGHVGTTPMLGLPGNPVSTMVCGTLFIRPVMRVLQGLPADEGPLPTARLGRDLPANDRREDYLRSRLDAAPEGGVVATPFDVQDSAMIARLAQADCLVVRAPHAPPARAGDAVDYLPIADNLADRTR